MSKRTFAVAAALMAASLTMMPASQAAAEKAGVAEKKAPSEKQLQQRARMKNCNKEAAEKDLKGEERKTFMSGCLKGESAASATSATKAKTPGKVKASDKVSTK